MRRKGERDIFEKERSKYQNYNFDQKIQGNFFSKFVIGLGEARISVKVSISKNFVKVATISSVEGVQILCVFNWFKFSVFVAGLHLYLSRKWKLSC